MNRKEKCEQIVIVQWKNADVSRVWFSVVTVMLKTVTVGNTL